METINTKFNSIDEYIDGSTDEVRDILQEIRGTINEAAPGAEEVISYRMPAFNFHGVLVYFAAFKDHIGFFPTSSGIEAFRAELSDYDFSKGTIRFPLNEPVPYRLIRRIVEYRVSENLEKNSRGKG